MIRPLKSLVEHAAERANIRTIPKITLIKLKAIQKSQTTCFEHKNKKGIEYFIQELTRFFYLRSCSCRSRGEGRRIGPILKQPRSLGQLTRVISDRSQYIDLLRAFAMELTSEQAEILKAFKTDAGADKRFFSFNRNSVNLPFCSCARISE